MRCLGLLLILVACVPTPRERYVQALNKKMSGDAQGYYEDLLALAHDVPDTRAGRRARATLASNSALSQAYVLGVLAAVAAPSFRGLQAQGARSQAEMGLRGLSTALRAFHAEHDRYCVSFEECGWQPPPGSPYVFFLSLEVTAAGDAAGEPDAIRATAAAVLSAVERRPMTTMNRFLIAAAANLDDDVQLDVWTLDDGGSLEHLASDI